jgi:hypothetical protein
MKVRTAKAIAKVTVHCSASSLPSSLLSQPIIPSTKPCLSSPPSRSGWLAGFLSTPASFRKASSLPSFPDILKAGTSVRPALNLCEGEHNPSVFLARQRGKCGKDAGAVKAGSAGWRRVDMVSEFKENAAHIPIVEAHKTIKRRRDCPFTPTIFPEVNKAVFVSYFWNKHGYARNTGPRTSESTEKML